MKDIVRKILIVINLVPDSDPRMSSARLTGVRVYVDKIGCCGRRTKPRRKEQGYGKEKRISQS